jgi:hypothetical protein
VPKGFKYSAVAGVALTTAALGIAISLAISLLRMNSVDLGFQTRDIGAISLVRRQGGLEKVDQFLRLALDELESAANVDSTVAVMAGAPTSPNMLQAPVEYDSGEQATVRLQAATGGYHQFFWY